MQLRSSFVKNIQATYGQEGKTWLENLPTHLKKLSERWSFQLIHPVENITYNFVALVKLQSRLAILKTAPPGAKLMTEAEWLSAHKKGVPTIFHIDEENNAYLMEKFEPGISLKYLVSDGNDEKATQIIAQIILDLQSANSLPRVNYQHISEHIASFDLLCGHTDTSLIDSAKSIFKNLCADRSTDIILHGDLHHDNILQNGTSWCVIDPHGYIGDPCAEAGTMIFNPLDCFPQQVSLKKIIEARLKILAEILPYNIERLHAWAFCLTLRSAAWDVESFGRPNKHTLTVANILYDTL